MQSSNKSLRVATNNSAVAHHRPATGKAYSRDLSKTIVIDKFQRPSGPTTKMLRGQKLRKALSR
jgi:hypothetical protein